MPFDGIFFKSISDELNASILNGRVEKITQVSKDEVIIQIFNGGTKYKLYISVAASNPRIHLTKSNYENPETPLNFCIFLRKHLLGSRISQVFLHGLERILEIAFEGYNEIGDFVKKVLIIEIMGKHSNIILLNDERKIMDSIKHIDFSTSRLREVMPGRDYVIPATQDKINSLEENINCREAFIENKTVTELEASIIASFYGFSPFISHRITSMALANANGDNLSEASCKVFEALIECIKNSNWKPYIIFSKGVPNDFHCLLSESFEQQESIHHFPSPSQAIDEYYLSRAVKDKFSQKKNDMIKHVKTKIEKCKKKITIQENKLSDVKDMDMLKIYGELLTANLYSIKDKVSSVDVKNYYSEDYATITIPLDINKSASDNTQMYFKKYAKAKNTFVAADSMIKKFRLELEYLEGLLFQLEENDNDNELNEIKEELISEGIFLERKKTRRSNTPSKPHEFISSDGFLILVGKNNRQNDRLTFKLTARHDIWLHTQKIHGSHVVIRTEKKDVPDTTLIEAGSIAAFFSKAKDDNNIPVDYTTIKYVKKPSNAKPGFVIYENFKTIIVSPNKELIERLRN